MSEHNETLADVLAEMKSRETLDGSDMGVDNFCLEAGEYGGFDALPLFKAYADRIEAAWKRERAEIEADALSVGGVVEAARHKPDPDWKATCAKCHDVEPDCEYYGEPNGCNSPIHGSHPTTEKSSAVGNMAAMREALVAIMDYVAPIHTYLPPKRRSLTALFAVADTIRNIAQKALAAPARNCDRFADELDAQLAFLNEVWLISIDRETMSEQDTYEKWTDEMRTRYGRWLLASATEQKGESNGNK